MCVDETFLSAWTGIAERRNRSQTRYFSRLCAAPPNASYRNEFWHIMRSCRRNQPLKFDRFLGFQLRRCTNVRVPIRKHFAHHIAIRYRDSMLWGKKLTNIGREKSFGLIFGCDLIVQLFSGHSKCTCASLRMYLYHSIPLMLFQYTKLLTLFALFALQLSNSRHGHK